MSDLGVDKHNTDAEVRDALEVCKRAKEEFMANIASIPVDNAAKAVYTRVADSLIESCLTSRDPAHCADLLSKDLATCPIVKDILVEANEVYKFVSIDCIDSICIQAKQQCHLPEATAAVNKVNTRMNLIHDFVRGAQNQGTFIAYLPTCDPFKKYYDKRTTQEKAKIDGFFQRCNHMRWERMDFLTSSLTVHFKRLHKVCCMSSVPLSAYILLCQAMRNEINKGLNAENGKFNRLLGKGAAQQVVNMIKPRFNMNGENPDGRKVGLVDPHQIWAFMADPCNHSWRSNFVLKVIFPFM
jgi:hypothetical protein